MESLNVTGGMLTEKNIKNLVNCVKLVGDLVLDHNYVSYSSAAAHLKQVKTVVGNVKIRSTMYPDFDFLSNLETIENRWETDSLADGQGSNPALFIKENIALTRLGLRSLRSVRGRVVIFNNPKLCTPPQSVVISRWIASDIQQADLVRMYGNRDANDPDCACSNKCKLSPPPDFTSQSCLAPNDPTQCLACNTFKADQTDECLDRSQCQPPFNYYVSNQDLQICSECNEQCEGGCTGPGISDCFSCKNLKRSSTGE